MERLAGRVAVVTGAASGIGRSLAARFAAEGMRCVLADVEEPALEAAVADLKVFGTHGRDHGEVAEAHRRFHAAAVDGKRLIAEPRWRRTGQQRDDQDGKRRGGN